MLAKLLLLQLALQGASNQEMIKIENIADQEFPFIDMNFAKGEIYIHSDDGKKLHIGTLNPNLPELKFVERNGSDWHPMNGYRFDRLWINLGTKQEHGDVEFLDHQRPGNYLIPADFKKHLPKYVLKKTSNNKKRGRKYIPGPTPQSTQAEQIDRSQKCNIPAHPATAQDLTPLAVPTTLFPKKITQTHSRLVPSATPSMHSRFSQCLQVYDHCLATEKEKN